MPRKKGETYSEYKARVLDSKSVSFCGAKWLNASLWLASGQTSSCHLPPAHNIDLDEIKSNPSALHNTKEKKQFRKQMQDGVRPTECDYCWKIEDAGPNLISDRVLKTQQFSDADLEQVFKTSAFEDSKLVSLEIAFDRTCQLACSYCSAALSTAWAQDIKSKGLYQNLHSDGASHFSHAGDHIFKYKNQENPYVQAFWKWWPELKKNLKLLRVTGGEPLLSQDFWQLSHFISQDKSIEDLYFGVNTNLMVPENLISRFILESLAHSKINLYTSAEAFGQQAEYIRDGFKYKIWRANLLRTLQEGQFENTMIMMTINALCLFSIVDFLNDMLAVKGQFPFKRVKLSLNILRFPSFQSPLVLSENLLIKFSEQLDLWLAKNIKSQYLDDSEKESVIRLIEYLRHAKSPHHQASPLKILRNDFKSFYQQYDVRRGYKAEEVFGSEFTEWYEQIKL